MSRAGETSGPLDPRAPLVEEDTFTLVVELEIRQAARLQYYVSLLALEVDIDGPADQIDRRALHQLIAGVIRDQIRRTDVVAVTSLSPPLQVLLVSAHLYNLPTVIERIVAAVARRAFDAAGHLARVSLSIGGACFPATARALPDLVRQAASLSIEARRDPGGPGHRYRLAHRAS